MRLRAVILLCVILLMGCASPDSPEAIAPLPDSVPEAKSMESLSDNQKQLLLQAVATEQNVSADQLQITTVKEADWPDACLGLAGPDELCAQLIVPGWAVTVTDGTNLWSYRTDLEMELIKLDTSGT